MDMKSEKYTINDGKWRMIGIPVLSLLIVVILNFEHIRFDKVLLYGFLINAFFSTIFWEGTRFIVIMMRRTFPAYSQTRRRLFVEALLAVLYVLLVSSLLDLLTRWLAPGNQTHNFGIVFRISIVPTLLICLIYEAVFFFEAWKSNVRRAESLEKEKIQSQLDALKSQMDPHFLFNSMNTLAALIDEDNRDAQLYLEKLADVYRYVLVHRNNNTVSLEEELGCVEAYVYLNKIRFRDNLEVTIEVSDKARRMYIIPLCLQMLVENAVKHNMASREKPLRISIHEEEEDNVIIVENNVSEKPVLNRSTKVGLQNIINRYSYLSDKKVSVVKTDTIFRVQIPLILNLS
jgi:sensor histidine kinase YesM